MTNIHTATDPELFVIFGAVMEEMRSRGLVRSFNNPVSDIAENLVARALSLSLNRASTKGYDGLDPQGRRVEVKCRRLSSRNPSRLLGGLRNLETPSFDLLAGVLFNEGFQVFRAALIPHRVVQQWSSYNRHTNGHRFVLADSVWNLPGVEDITGRLQEVQLQGWIDSMNGKTAAQPISQTRFK